MNKKDEALKMAIDLIDGELLDLAYEQRTDFKSKYAGGYKLDRIKYAEELVETTKSVIQACKEALEQPTQEPVAWITEWDGQYSKGKLLDWDKLARGNAIHTPLYTHPKEWQGLSDDEIDHCETFYAPPMHPDYIKDDNWYDFIKAIEQKLKEKQDERDKS